MINSANEQIIIVMNYSCVLLSVTMTISKSLTTRKVCYSIFTTVTLLWNLLSKIDTKEHSSDPAPIVTSQRRAIVLDDAYDV